MSIEILVEFIDYIGDYLLNKDIKHKLLRTNFIGEPTLMMEQQTQQL